MKSKYQNNKHISTGAVVAGVAGATAIAGAAVAAAVVLRDKKTREKVKNVLLEVKDKAMDYVDDLKLEDRAQQSVQSIKKVAAATQGHIRKEVEKI